MERRIQKAHLRTFGLKEHFKRIAFASSGGERTSIRKVLVNTLLKALGCR
jgi:hypothetical protein